ncbi:MAG: hypothetical protein SOV31_06520 [Candidatus Cryptobacteroides sp.]|nr:hypothetical protein [Candidatus Cryptobacteroides sp.]
MPLRPLQAKQFSVATTKIRIGRRPRCRYDRCRRAIPHCSSDDAASIPKSGPEIKNRCSLWDVLEGFLASIPKSGLEIKNRCSLWAVLEGFFASIPKFGPEIKNRCTQQCINGENLASIRKSGLEIKNRCSRGVVAFCRRNHSPSRRRKLESDADLVAATTAAGETILLRGNED